MEWVEISAKTLEAAKEAALGQLGVAEADAEVIVLDEPKAGLFGRVRGEARVRARVRPVGARPKRARRQRERTRDSGRHGGDHGRRGEQGTVDEGNAEERPPEAERQLPGGNGSHSTPNSGGQSRSAKRRRARARAKAARTTAGNGVVEGGPAAAQPATGADVGRIDAGSEEAAMAEGVSLEEQGEVARKFVEGLLDELGLEATVDTRLLDEDTVEIAADGEGLGVLVGPKGATLAALQDVTRTVVQRQFPVKTDRILVDVARYRERRATALQRFSQQVAAEVLETGTERALEPMSPPDRKVVHDAVNAIDGVQTRSEGEEPERYIVVSPAG